MPLVDFPDVGAATVEKALDLVPVPHFCVMMNHGHVQRTRECPISTTSDASNYGMMEEAQDPHARARLARAERLHTARWWWRSPLNVQPASS